MPIVSDLPITLRPSTGDDVPLIVQSWYRTLRRDGPGWMRSMPSDAFDRLVLPRIRSLAGACRMACSTEDPGTVFGFACAEGGIVHMVFVKSKFRRVGVARRLLGGVGPDAVYSAVTPSVRRLMKAGKLPDGWVYDEAGMWRSREAA